MMRPFYSHDYDPDADDQYREQQYFEDTNVEMQRLEENLARFRSNCIPEEGEVIFEVIENDDDEEEEDEETEYDDSTPSSSSSSSSSSSATPTTATASASLSASASTSFSASMSEKKKKKNKRNQDKNTKRKRTRRKKSVRFVAPFEDHQHQQLQALEDGIKPQTAPPPPLSLSTKKFASEPHHMPRPPIWLIPVLMACVIAGTSLWFSGNVVLQDLAAESNNIDEGSLGLVVSAVNSGFIAGALSFAITSAVDRMPPTRLFMRCAIMGSIANLWMAFIGPFSVYLLLILRFITGFCLAGIYPVVMKVASDWYQDGLGTAMGFLVGSVVMGTALPFLLDRIPFAWRGLIALTSALATCGGLVMGLFVPDGPYRKPAIRFDPKGVLKLLTHNVDYRAACFAYFAHMWEVYVYWGFVVVVWKDYLEALREDDNSRGWAAPGWDENTIAFVAIGIGWPGCILGGYASEVVGSAVVAVTCMISSSTLCLLSPLFYYLPPDILLVVYLFWGMVVVADTPQLSTLISQAVPGNKRGSALTLSTCLGFAVSILSVQLVSITQIKERYIFLPCGPGPLLGVFSLRRLLLRKNTKGGAGKKINDNYKQDELIIVCKKDPATDKNVDDDDDEITDDGRPQTKTDREHDRYRSSVASTPSTAELTTRSESSTSLQTTAVARTTTTTITKTRKHISLAATACTSPVIAPFGTAIITPFGTEDEMDISLGSSSCEGFENYLRGEEDEELNDDEQSSNNQ